MSQQILNGVSTVLSVCALTFFLVGCVGFSASFGTIEDVAWIKGEEGPTDVYFGLQKFYFTSSGNGATLNYNNCAFDFCDACKHDGRAAFGLLILATISAAVCSGLGGALAAGVGESLQIANAGVSFLSASFAIIGFGVFMGDCYKQIDDSDNVPFLSLEWGRGSIVVCTGLILMFLVVVLQIAAMIVGPSA
mmetsp:Transcript_46353/g.107315  ORF Transcript_46353/g.107315 Transcript_46353/m.107315 type:complete len:192 (+) Transcript_46353:46-621(+)|eukprot:CAMPEP_0170380056 /NCGR_PEP_ID=MMETSP0117_2-20130122/13668_1 /TAXON_ID=400756 /ORGANISM="Durinskia baltica, Strain CSIRO CS-38" /LENGTH=191 /DNA_ID=CAMNT_0010635527 /DNA_START=47 /DNA_END=622 /DNA_ORIENTATION=+